MKAVTISQPYATLIASGEKWVENRTWAPQYRGLIAIHAGKGRQYLSRQELVEYPTSCVIATARLAACVRLQAMTPEAAAARIPDTERTFAELLQHEYTEGPWCWIFEDVRELDEPIPVRGAQGLWGFQDELMERLV